MKAIKWVAALGVLMLLAGAAMFAAGMSQAGWEFDRLDPENLTAEVFTSQQEIDSVTLDGWWNYEIVRGEQFRVDYYSSDFATVSATEAPHGPDGKYAFTLKETRKIEMYFGVTGIKRAQVSVKVTLTETCDLTVNGSGVSIGPGQDFKNLTIRGSSASVNLESASVQNVTLNGSDLRATFRDVAMQDFSLTGSSARATFIDVTAGDVLLKGSDLWAAFTRVTAGDLTMDGSSVHGDFTEAAFGAVTVLGSDAHCTLRRTSADSVSQVGSSCALTLEGTQIAQTVSVDASDGRLILNDSSARHVQLKGSSARVTGQKADVRDLDAKGSSVRIELALVGTKSEFASVTASGSSGKVTVDGEKGSSFIGGGYKKFSLSGSDAQIILTMLGGESIFAE